MVFKRPATGRDDRQGRSSGKTSSSSNRPKRDYKPKENSSAGEGKSEYSKSPGKYKPAASGDRPFSGPRKDSSFKSNDQGKDFSPAKKRPYGSRPAGEQSRDSSPAKKRPYSGRPSGEQSRDSFPAKKRPYGDRPPGEQSRGSFPAKKRPYGDKPSGDQSRDSFPANKRPYSGRPAGAEGDSFRPAKRAESNNKFSRSDASKTGRPEKRENPHFKKPFGDKPFATGKPSYSRPAHGETPAGRKVPVKVMRSRKKAVEEDESGLIRLNRYIANAGICSRRKADELISAGVVAVNGTVISELGFKVDPMKDKVSYNGETLKREKMVYVLLNKPKDYITTTEDPQERRTVMHLVEKASRERIYPVGRLDRNTTGLLLMTNDGDLADKLSHPRNSIVKLYQVELSKSLTQGDLNKIGFGVELEDGLIKPDAISYVSGATKREVGIQIHSGKNRIVRRIFEHLGYEVVKLDRVVYANLTKKDLPRGRWRYLEEHEVVQLKHFV